MKIGEVVEVLIQIKRDYRALSREEQAIIEACILLAKMPRMEEAKDYAPVKN